MDTNVFPVTQTETKIKSYWNRPGGKIGTILGLGALAAIGYYVFPIMTNIVWNTINLGIACAVGFALFMFLSNRKLWLGIFYLYEIIIKKFVGIIIELDPFIIAENYIADIEKEREALYDKALEVDGQKEAIVAKIHEKEVEKNKQINIAAAAKQLNELMDMANAARQVTRLDNYIKQLTPIKENLIKVSDYLTKVHKNSKYMVVDMKNELETRKDLYNSITKGNNALTSALKIFNGDPDKKLMMEQSMDYLREDMAGKLANMKKAISASSDFMRGIDLENASYQTEGLKMLEEYKPELFQYNTDSEKQSFNSESVLKNVAVDIKSYEDLLK